MWILLIKFNDLNSFLTFARVSQVILLPPIFRYLFIEVFKLHRLFRN